MLSDPINQVFTDENALGPGAAYIGPWYDLYNFNGVSVLLAGSEVVDEGRLEWSNNANTVRYVSTFIAGVAPTSFTGGAASFLVSPLSRYVRVVVENGSVQQPDADYLVQLILLVTTPDAPQTGGGGGGGGGLTNTELRASPVPMRDMNKLVPSQYDYIELGYTGDDVTTVIYKQGGSGGTTVATLALAYSSPGVLSSVVRS